MPGVTVATYVPTKGARPYITLVPSIFIVDEVDTTTRDVAVSVVTSVPEIAISPSVEGIKHVPSGRPGGAVGTMTGVGVGASVVTLHLLYASLVSVFFRLGCPSTGHF